MNIAYHPGCALHGSSNDYEQSLRACLGALDVQLNEVKDWTCCGATAAHAFNHKLSLALPAQSRASRARRPQTTVRALPALFHATAEGAKSPGWKPTACRVVTDCRGRPARRRTSPESDSAPANCWLGQVKSRGEGASQLHQCSMLLRLPADPATECRALR